jgi:hypothetical protein
VHFALKGGFFMPANKVMDDENITIWYYPESRILYHEIHKFFSGDKYRDIMSKAADIFKQNGALKWLSDDRAVQAFKQEDLEWGDKEWFPRVHKSGWQYWAIVKPESTVGQMTMNDMAKNFSSRGVQTKFFSSVDDAREWLESFN